MASHLFRGQGLSVGGGPLHPVFFVGPEDDTQRPARRQTKLLDDAQRLPGRHAACAIIMHSLAHVPGIVVTAHDHDLFRAFAAGDFCDDVE